MKLAKNPIQWLTLLAMLNLRGLDYRYLEHSVVLRHYRRKCYKQQDEGNAPQLYHPLPKHDPYITSIFNDEAYTRITS
jgi:hypothetical protein